MMEYPSYILIMLIGLNKTRSWLALAFAAVEISWIQQLLADLGVSMSTLPVLRSDNRTVMSLASNPVFHAWKKHIEVDYHFEREKVVNIELTVQFVACTDQVADIFNKALCSPQFLLLHSKLHLRELTLSLSGHIDDKFKAI